VCYSVLQCIPCCSRLWCVLQCVAVCCSVSQCVAVCCSCCKISAHACGLMQRLALGAQYACCSTSLVAAACGVCCSVLKCVTVAVRSAHALVAFCSASLLARNAPRVAASCVVRCSKSQRVAASCSVLQRVTACCSVLQVVRERERCVTVSFGATERD